MRSRSAFILGIQQLLGREHADLRIAQYLFLLPVALDLTTVAVVHDHGPGTWYVGGVVLVLAATALAVAIGRDGASERLTVLVPTLDIMGVGFMRVLPDTTIGLALIFPAIRPGAPVRPPRGRHRVAAMIFSATFGPRSAARPATRVERARRIAPGGHAGRSSLGRCRADRRDVEVAGGEAAEAHAARLELAMADVIEQRRLTRTIVNGVDVGLVALDATGAYDTMNPRHQEFIDLAYPTATVARPARPGFVFEADGVTLLSHEQHAHGPGGARRVVPRLPDLGRRGAGGATGAGGVVHRRTSATTATSAAPCSPTTTSPSW